MAVFNHIRQALWALAVLWKFKTIRRIDRLRLWMKTVRLYASLLAFTDAWRPKQQLGNAAICALITALYDYEIDWVPISNKKDSITVRIIHQYVGHGYASAIAEKLFQEDLGDQLTADGLERGSVAFAFYRAVIGSTWLKAYSVQDVAALGRLLQILDDALDVEKDRTVGDKNCLLLDYPDRYIAEGRSFLGSGFYRALEESSPLYKLLHWRALEAFNALQGVGPSTRELFRATRPHTAAFALVLTLVGFKLTGFEWIPALLSAIAFGAATASIMVFNDLMDRDNDVKKGKALAFEHPAAVFGAWQKWSGTMLLFLLPLSIASWQLVLFIGVVWSAGTYYSFAGLRYPWNNVLVAACSASPVLVGPLHAGVITTEVVQATFVGWAIFWLIHANEIVKDVGDVDVDKGYKVTLATKTSPAFALIVSIMLVFPAALGIVLLGLPYWVTMLMAIPLVAFTAGAAFGFARALTGRKAPPWISHGTSAFMAMLLAALLVY